MYKIKAAVDTMEKFMGFESAQWRFSITVAVKEWLLAEVLCIVRPES